MVLSPSVVSPTARVLDPAAGMPLYRQLAEVLQAEIGAGVHAPGSTIPAETALAARFGVGRPTVRQATDFLVRQGLLERRRGAGTFVRPPEPAVDLFTLSGTVAAFAQQGLALDMRLVEATALREVPAQEGHPLSGRRVYTLARVGRLQGKPVLLERLFLEPTVFPNLDRLSLAGQSLSELVARHYGRRPLGGRQLFGVARVPAPWSRALKVGPGESLLLVRRTLDFPGAPAALFALMYCRVELAQTLNGKGQP
ncbi:MAG TPA: GntR family transcriptional regulator [Polyangia bacterium]